MNYYDNMLSYYKVIIRQMIKGNPNINEELVREAFNYYMNTLSTNERKNIANEMRYATGLLEMVLSKPVNTEMKLKYLGSIKTCMESIIICFASGALLSIPALFEYMHEQVIELTGYIGVFGKMDIEYRDNYIRR